MCSKARYSLGTSDRTSVRSRDPREGWCAMASLAAPARQSSGRACAPLRPATRRSPFYGNLRRPLYPVIKSESVDPVRNPYAPGAGQRPPELAGRDRELQQFEVVLERVARGRPERSMVLTGLRGVGKTVLLNSFRSMAMQRLWGTGKLEAKIGRAHV